MHGEIIIVLGVLSIMISGALGMYLDVYRDMNEPLLYWMIGALGVCIGLTLIRYGMSL